MKALGIALAAIATMTLSAGAATAQGYPVKPVRVITANSAGGTSDIFVRALGDELQKKWGQPVIVENRSGGGMNIAGRACAEAPSDGYTICILPGETLVLNQFTYKSIPYDPVKDFVPITNLFINTQVMVVSSKLGVNSLDALARLSKEKPGTLAYSALSIPMQIMVDQWKKKSGADIVFVPARGGADIVNGLLTGTAPVAIVGLPNFIPHIRNDTVKALAVDSKQRSPLFPNVPTLHEIGYPAFAPVYFGFVGPAGIPDAVVRKIYDDVKQIGNDTTFRQKRLLDIGIEPVFDTPEQFGAYIKAQRASAGQTIKESGFQPR
jgi:tripartite-type tricarboxylate transporter receptor subunit TctC